MSMIFPGMDPYLENPLIWQGFHNAFVVHIRDHLQPLIRPRYIASVEDRVVVEGPERREIAPDVWIKRRREGSQGTTAAVMEAEAPIEIVVSELEIHENFIEILDRESGQRVVTVIEALSPWNKFPGPGRDLYLKQREVRNSQSHLVEIDLLRTGPQTVPVPEWMLGGRGAYDYLVCINRAEERRERFQVYLCRLRRRLPRIRIPLADPDPDVFLDLQAVLAYSYEMGSYRDRLRYDRPCVPPLAPEDQAWADELIRAAMPAQSNP